MDPLDDGAAARANSGFSTAAFAGLPTAARAILCTVCVATGLFLIFFAVYGLRILAKLGKQRGNDDSRAYLPGGLTGIVAGAVALCYVANLLTATILTTQDSPSLSAVAALAILIPAILAGAILGGRWIWLSKILVSFAGGLSTTLLLALSFHIRRQSARLIVLAVILCLATAMCAVLAIPRLHCHRASTRALFLLSSATGAWVFSLGIDIFAQVGLLDAMSLFASDTGLLARDAVVEETVIMWDTSGCKALIAGAWLLTAFGTAFQCWRYSVIGDDPDDEWNSYLGTLLKDEKSMVGHTPLLDHGRSGVFSAREGFFSRLFSSKTPRKTKQPAIYKGDMEALPTLDKDDMGMQADNPVFPRFPGSSATLSTDGKSKPPARYDTLYPGLGLYDDHDEKSGDLAGYGESGRPLYDPVQYQQRSLAPGLIRNDSEPSFRSVPPYEPPMPGSRNNEERTPSLSGSTVYNRSVDGDTKSARLVSGKLELYEASPDLSASGPLTSVFGIAKSVAFEEEPRSTSKSSPTMTKLDTRNRNSHKDRVPSPTLSPGLRAASPRLTSTSPYGSPVLPPTTENPYEQIAVQATPSLLNAIKRVSAAQRQAKEWRTRQTGSQSGLGIGVPDRDQEVLKAAAARRRQSSQAEWWSEVEKKAGARSGSSGS